MFISHCECDQFWDELAIKKHYEEINVSAKLHVNFVFYEQSMLVFYDSEF